MPVHKQKARTLRLAVILILLTKGLMGIGQDLNPQTRNAGQFPTVVFNCSRSGATPPFYSIAVDSTGSATYESLPNSGAPYTMEFLASDATRTRIFAMIESLKFLRGFGTDPEFNVASSIHTLTFTEGGQRNQIQYDATSNTNVHNLTALFERISSTLEFGRRLGIMEQNDPAAIEPEIGRLKEMIDDKQLAELQTLSSILLRIVSDPRISRGSRQQAQLILNRIGTSNSSGR
ncbi:MAG TPA: hypothetical protein VKB49_32210 [Candidatus Sulfotelmatobacter sp.]|nr:hypothetical protein [Candidatus Sulfotelmatobacter sp.]